MQPDGGDLELLNHYSVVIYPFLHDVTGRNRDERLEALTERWAPWWSRLEDGQLAAALEDTSFFLPYIRGLLYPETERLQEETPGENYANWVRAIRWQCARGLAPFCRDLPVDSVLRLTCRDTLHAALADFTLVQNREGRGKGGPTEIPGRLEWLDAVLFPAGIGFLLLKVRLRQDRPGLARLIELNRQLRLVLPPSLSWTLPVLHFHRAETAVRVRELMNFLTQGLAGDLDPASADKLPVPTPAHAGARQPYTDTEAGRAYGERCHVLSYACVHLTEEDRAGLATGAFVAGAERVLFEFAACIGLGETVHNPMWVPAPEQARRVGADNQLSLWRCWKAMVLKESCVFLALEDLAFNRRTLPHTIENDYLPLYVYTLFQKFQLFVFANALMHRVARVGEHLREARSLARRFVAFRTRYWFSDVTRKPQGGDLYRKLHEGLDVMCLYQIVTGSVKEAREYYEDRQNRQVQLVRDLLTWIFGPVAATFGAISVFLAGAYPWWAKGLLLAVLAAGSMAVLLRLRKGRNREGTAPARRRPRRRPGIRSDAAQRLGGPHVGAAARTRQ